MTSAFRRRRLWFLIPPLAIACSVELAPTDDESAGGTGGNSGQFTDSGNKGGGGGAAATAGTGGGLVLGGGTAGTPSGGGGASGGATGGVGPGATGGTPSDGAAGTAGKAPFQCFDVSKIQPSCFYPEPANCLCQGCDPSGICYDSGQQLWFSDCVCAACKNEPNCMTVCDADGLCNPYYEGCGCVDCADHPQCW